jgi:hypothetical protein
LSAAAFRAGAIALLSVLCAVTATAQDSAAAPPQQDEHPAADIVKFVGGGVLALALHESGHLIFDGIFDAQPRLEAIHFGPFPFFAVTHRTGMPPRQEFMISSAGFWMQESTDEWLLTRRWCRDTAGGCSLRDDRSWLPKGMLAFNVLNSVGYAMVAFAKAGPSERDTRGMADSIGVDERTIGIVVLAPAVIDAYRYFRPDSRMAVWLSRGVKIGSVLLVLR